MSFVVLLIFLRLVKFKVKEQSTSSVVQDNENLTELYVEDVCLQLVD